MQHSPSHLPCPLCGGLATRLFAKSGIWVASCRDCAHRFADFVPGEDHVATVYGDSYFNGGGAGYSDYLSEARLLREQGRRYSRIVRRFAPVGNLLDVGAAAGFILQGFVDDNWTGVGLEPNDSMATYARERLSLDVRTGGIEEFADGKGTYDLVTVIQVVNHLARPRATLATIAGLIRHGGLCLIENWNRASWSARAFGKHWHEYSPPSVLQWFSADSLAGQLREHGLEEVARGRPVKYINGAHAKSLLRHKLGTSLFGRAVGAPLGLIPNRLAIRYPSEDLCWLLFRKVDQV